METRTCCSKQCNLCTTVYFSFLALHLQPAPQQKLSDFIMWRKWVNSLSNYTSPTDTNLHTNTIVLQTFIISGFCSVGHDILPVKFHSSSVSQQHCLVITLIGGTTERFVIQECLRSFKLTNPKWKERDSSMKMGTFSVLRIYYALHLRMLSGRI